MDNRKLSNESLLAALKWRYAAKKFDAAKKIADADWKTLEEALVLSPSSFGLQPWKFIVVTDARIRSQLVPVSWDQTQVVDCSHYVVFAIKKQVGTKEIDRFLRRISEVRGMPVEKLGFYRDLMISNLVNGPRSGQIDEWTARQVYLALGNFMTAAAVLGIDTCPMEGLQPEEYDRILGLPARGLATAVACAAGYRAADDKYASLPKVRYASEEVIERI